MPQYTHIVCKDSSCKYMYIVSAQLLEQLLKNCQSDDVCLASSLFGISPYRILWTKGKHVKAQLGTSDSTSSVSWWDLLWLLRMWALPGAQLGGVVTPLSHPQLLPQVMTVCQWLLRIWWEWELQEHVQHKASVSWTLYCIFLDADDRYELHMQSICHA